MGTTTSRMYAGEADLHAMLRLVAHTIDRERAQFIHVGDVLWGLYQNTVFDPFTHIRVWEDEQGELASFAWIDRHSSLLVYAHPRLEGALEPEMLDWAERQARILAAGGEPMLHIEVQASDAPLLALLEGRGYQREEEAHLYMRQELDRDIPPPQPPEGWAVRGVGGEDEWEERVDLHREVWHRSSVTLDAYRRMQEAPGYDHTLDLVAVSPEGGFGAYCIVWYDPVTQIGEFEPVGTRAAYRGRGLGRAVLLEGLRRLQSRGARSAIVYSLVDNAPAVKLYELVGFRTRDRFLTYGRVVE